MKNGRVDFLLEEFTRVDLESTFCFSIPDDMALVGKVLEH